MAARAHRDADTRAVGDQGLVPLLVHALMGVAYEPGVQHGVKGCVGEAVELKRFLAPPIEPIVFSTRVLPQESARIPAK